MQLEQRDLPFTYWMRIPLQSRSAKMSLLGIIFTGAVLFLFLTATELLAAFFSQSPDLARLNWAIRLQPGNAEYHYQKGRYLTLVQSSFGSSASCYREAVQLNPHKAHYWLDLARTYLDLADTKGQQDALEHALAADPTTPEIAWDAANFYIVRGEQEKAFHELRVVIANDPYMPLAAIRLGWQVSPDIDKFLAEVIPPKPDAYLTFLGFLISKNERVATTKVWAKLVKLNEPIDSRYVLGYVQYLLAQKDVEQAQLVWVQASNLAGLSQYQPSPANLVVNGDFSLDVLNGGFDWSYYRHPSVSLALDPIQTHSGHQSLLITFNRAKVSDAGIQQLIPVQSNTNYQFSAYCKTENMEGAGGPRFAIQDAYDSTLFFASDDLRDADFWKPISGNFSTGPNTKLVVLRVQRVPPESPIQGKLWIDGIRISPAPAQGQ